MCHTPSTSRAEGVCQAKSPGRNFGLIDATQCAKLPGVLPDVAPRPRMTRADYLEWEPRQSTKHELYRGEVFAMAGGSPRHNLLAAAMMGELRAALTSNPCHVLSSDQRIAARDGEHYVYSDAVVVCGNVRTEAGTRDVLSNPGVVVEVLSPSTESYDRGDKWQAYRQLASLSDYLLVSQAIPRIEHFQREADGSWHYRVFGAGERVVLSNGASIAVDGVYRGAFEIAAD